MLAVLAGPVTAYVLARRTKAWLLVLLVSPFLCFGFVAAAETLWWFVVDPTSSVMVKSWATFVLMYARPVPAAEDIGGVTLHCLVDGVWAVAGGIASVAWAYVKERRRALAQQE